MVEKEKGSDAMLPPGSTQRIEDMLYAEQRRLDAEQLRVERQPVEDDVPASP